MKNQPDTLNILLLSAYDAGSHRQWCRGLVAAFPEYRWTELTLPARHFRWRIRGNPLSFIHDQGPTLRRPYDLLICTSMVDLATLRGLVPQIARTPALCYFHENQFEYPRSQAQHPGVEPQMVNLYSALAAERVLFNSEHNRRTFMEGADRLMAQLPDHRPKRLSTWFEGKTAVLPVPLEDHRATRTCDKAERFTLVWNHRWEYDKAPERLLRSLELVSERGVDFELLLMGERFRRYPPEMDRLRERFGDRIGQFGFVESADDYRRLLGRAHLVLSTSLHEFQGLAVLEAVAQGAVPVVPDRLSYAELFAPAFRYDSYPEDAEAEAQALAGAIEGHFRDFAAGALVAAPAIDQLLWTRMKPAYGRAMRATLAARED